MSAYRTDITQYYYDKCNRLIKTIDSEEHITEQSHDAVGNIEAKKMVMEIQQPTATISLIG